MPKESKRKKELQQGRSRMKKKEAEIVNLKKIIITIEVEQILNREEITVEEQATEKIREMLELEKEKIQGVFWGLVYAPKIKVGKIKEKIKEKERLTIIIVYEDEKIQEKIVTKYMVEDNKVKISGIEGKIITMKIEELNKIIKSIQQAENEKIRCYIKFITPTILEKTKNEETCEITFDSIINAIEKRRELVEKKIKEKIMRKKVKRKEKRKVPKVKIKYIDIKATKVEEELGINGKIVYEIKNPAKEVLEILAVGEIIGIGEMIKENTGIARIEMKRE